MDFVSIFGSISLKGIEWMCLFSKFCGDSKSNSLNGICFVKIRAGVEMALIDAVANSIRVPLWRLFGGVTSTLTTAITVEFDELLR